MNGLNFSNRLMVFGIMFISYFLSLTSIFTFFFFGEIRNLTTFCLLPLVNNGFSLSSFFLSLLSFLWIGAQFPQEKFLSYGRILTLHYYFLLMCILFSNFFLLRLYSFLLLFLHLSNLRIMTSNSGFWNLIFFFDSHPCLRTLFSVSYFLTALRLINFYIAVVWYSH